MYDVLKRQVIRSAELRRIRVVGGPSKRVIPNPGRCGLSG
jgi:hypothetical protein